MMKIALFTFLIAVSGFSYAEEISSAYQGILIKYAEVALIEFDLAEGQSLSGNISGSSGTIATGTDKIGRTFYVVLYPSKSGSVYVAMELSKDGYLQVYSRGGLHVSPKEFAGNFSAHISKVVHYPGAT